MNNDQTFRLHLRYIITNYELKIDKYSINQNS